MALATPAPDAGGEVRVTMPSRRLYFSSEPIYPPKPGSVSLVKPLSILESRLAVIELYGQSGCTVVRNGDKHFSLAVPSRLAPRSGPLSIGC